MNKNKRVQQQTNEKAGVDSLNVFIKFLPPQLTDEEFRQLFSSFGDVVSSKIMVDQATGRSLGYGFVRYKNPESAQRAIEAMNGQKVYNKRLLCKLANASTRATATNHVIAALNVQTPSNNLYIKPLALGTSEDDLRKMFSKFGNVIDCKVMIDKVTGQSRQIGFVRFETEEEAQAAINEMNGKPIGDDPQIVLTVKFADTELQKAARRALRQQQQQLQQARAAAAAIPPHEPYWPWWAHPPPPGPAPYPYPWYMAGYYAVPSASGSPMFEPDPALNSAPMYIEPYYYHYGYPPPPPGYVPPYYPDNNVVDVDAQPHEEQYYEATPAPPDRPKMESVQSASDDKTSNQTADVDAVTNQLDQLQLSSS